jgi:hypothetical protein
VELFRHAGAARPGGGGWERVPPPAIENFKAVFSEFGRKYLLNFLRLSEKIGLKFSLILGENLEIFSQNQRNFEKFLKFSPISAENMSQIFFNFGRKSRDFVPKSEKIREIPQIFSDFGRKYTSKRFFRTFSHFPKYPPPAFTSSRRPCRHENIWESNRKKKVFFFLYNDWSIRYEK